MSDLNHTSRLLVVLVLVLAITLFSIHHVDGDSGGAEVEWLPLTKSNYSSQIRIHPHLLLLVTVPWSGESRSLMKRLAHAVASDQARFGNLKLMVLYRNVERMLADALGATDGVTILYYHNTFSYKYQGKISVQGILSSVHYVMSLPPEELPLKSLTTSDELKGFLDSTDKAVLLLELCGWTQRFFTMNNNTNRNDFSYLGAFNGGNNGTRAAKGNIKVDGLRDEELTCNVDNELSENSWLSQFTAVNYSLMKEAENLTFNAGVSCTLEESQNFKLFLHKYITVAREFFLPPERIRFAVVRERSLLPLLNIEEPYSWMMTVHFAGCPRCTKVLQEGDDLRTVLQTKVSPVIELEDDPYGVEALLTAKRPSILLFVDRSSNSTQIRRESHVALNAFRELAQHCEMSNQSTSIKPDKAAIKSKQASWDRHPRLQSPPASEKSILKDKMSIIIMKDGRQITLENLIPELQDSSVHEILTYTLNRRREIKLSSLAKDAGFQLLSKDFEVEVVESLPPHSEVPSNEVLGELPGEGCLESAVGLDEIQVPAASSSVQHEDLPNLSDAGSILMADKKDALVTSSQSSVESEHGHQGLGIVTDIAKVRNAEEGGFSGMDEKEKDNYFDGSFYFSDGQYRLLESLTGGSKIPSMVIIDPVSQQHYVLEEQVNLSYYFLSDFVNGFLNGKLPPYQQSAPMAPSPRDAPRPPYVNLDFHETDSIPLVTTHTFTELVLSNTSDPKSPGHSWDRNVLVLFSNSWCGFCQRMELVVREVYRAIKGYSNMKMISSTEHVEEDVLKLPLMYKMDCLQNDCGSIIRPLLQRELYPVLLLFPAERKNNVVAYEGDIAVSDIIKFLVAHGSHVADLIMDKSFLMEPNSAKHNPRSRNSHHEVLLKDRLENTAVEYNQINTRFLVGSYERPQLFPGCVLSATEKLQDVHPFDESKILIVKADQITGFQGLIINKHINWDSLEKLEGLELLKEAPLSFGGPVMTRGMPLVALTHKYTENRTVEVLSNVYFVDQLTTLGILEDIRAGNLSVSDYWFFLGYSSWGWDQLFIEIAQGAWDVSRDSLEQMEWPWR